VGLDQRLCGVRRAEIVEEWAYDVRGGWWRTTGLRGVRDLRFECVLIGAGAHLLQTRLQLTEHERIVLTRDLLEHGLEAGDVGTILHVYENAQAYEVEFVALNGRTVAVVTVPSKHIRPVRQDEITHARAMAATG
jgi:hypothetical protein